MGLFSKNKKQTKESGYVSFSEEDLRAGAQSNEANAEAYELLDAAMTTSSHITQKDKEGNTVNVDDIYPCSLEECDEMDALLDKAEEAAQDKRDEFFRERLAELREIVDWSRKKHWTFKWPLIFGCIVSIFLLNWCHSDAEDDLKRATRDYEMVDNWTEQDTTVAWNNCERGSFGIEYKSANAYKLSKLQNLKRNYESVSTTIDGLKGRQTYAENQHAKDSLQNVIESHVESQKKFRADYDAINQMKFKELKKEALKSTEGYMDSKASDSRWIMFYIIFCVVLIPLYIWTSYQPGYYVTRHRAEAKALGCIQKVGFSIASFLLGAGLAMALLPDYEVTTHYSDGSTSKHTESNSANFVILAFKFLLMAAGVIFYCFISLLIMTIATATALKRKYDWGKVASSAVAGVASAASAVSDKMSKKE